MNLQYFKHNYTYITNNGEIHNLSPQGYLETDLTNLFILCFLKGFVVIEHDGNLDDPKTWNVLMQIPSEISLAQQSIVLNILKNKKDTLSAWRLIRFPVLQCIFEEFSTLFSLSYETHNNFFTPTIALDSIDLHKSASLFR